MSSITLAKSYLHILAGTALHHVGEVAGRLHQRLCHGVWLQGAQLWKKSSLYLEMSSLLDVKSCIQLRDRLLLSLDLSLLGEGEYDLLLLSLLRCLSLLLLL